jgi:hypothetical protein
MRNYTVELIARAVVRRVTQQWQKVTDRLRIVTALGEPIVSENMEDPLIERTEFPVAENAVGLKTTISNLMRSSSPENPRKEASASILSTPAV